MVGISETIIWHVISLYRCHVHVSHWFSAMALVCTNDVVYKVLHMKGGSVELMFWKRQHLCYLTHVIVCEDP